MANFDVTSAQFHADPFPTFARMRADGHLVTVKLPIVGRTRLAVSYEACAVLLKGHETFARDPANAGLRTQARILSVLPRTFRALALNMLGYDDPEHRRLRGLVDQAFQRRVIDSLKPIIAASADRILDRLETEPEPDIVAHVARELPLDVICRILGLPAKDYQRFKAWLGGLTDTANIWSVVKALPGVISTVRYLRRAARPGGGSDPEGLIAALRDVETEGGRLTEDEIVSMIFLLFGAGQETTAHLIAGGLHALLSDEEQLQALRDDRSVMATCVEECLRYVSPVQMTKPRFATRDGDLLGEPFLRGEMFAAFLGAANSDPAKFENPHRFDIRRLPNPHLSFGTGVHFCLGFQLVRAEAGITFERILTRFPAIRLGGGAADLTWHKRLGLRSLTRLPINLGIRG